MIRTSHDTPPIPIRTHDWSAWDDERPEAATGHGATEAEAVADLLMWLELRDDDAGALPCVRGSGACEFPRARND